ncbi:ABC transporter substrate-binding protein [Planosporangium mesophilum]|uniref:ABC transporter substrate-binding protein n=1 Tax=Planosporangium mesophilum TaxID=689768 RepID=A0A8J3TDW2_9ACTN|nr:ABC transporter substrate-binding protein [Planosporangium mesophilum]NJC85456.1 ABC transporter substrate-binding protein [Planosporangium mesophilum]GII24032.1 ABC transporter substrate-binding protein [Planosporangium mesophilum]
MPEHLRLSRRGLLSTAGALGLGALMTACGGGRASGDGSWSFTDDRGQQATAAGRPQRVVAYVGSAAALRDFGAGDRIAGVFGPTKRADGRPDPLAGDLDVDKLTVLGNAWGEFSLERYAALRPELLVTNMYQPGALWFVPDNSKDKILALAPSVAFTVAKVSLPKVIQRYADLAAALGADLEAARVTEAKARFDRASETLRTAAAAAGGLTVMAASASADLLYVSDPDVYADLSYFRELGVDFVVPTNVTGGFFENLSWENADRYRADLILLDSRTAALQPPDLVAKPTWSNLPAVKAGQVVPWLSEPRFSHAGCAPLVEALATALRSARKVA